MSTSEKIPFSYGIAHAPIKHKSEVTLIFNALNGAYLSSTNIPYAACDQSDPLCIYIRDEMDLATESVVGGLIIKEDGTWEVDYTIEDTAELESNTVYEEQLDTLVAYKITKEYPVTKQINILAASIVRLSEAVGCDLPELKEWLDYIRLVKETNRRHKEFYQNDDRFTYVSKEEVHENNTKLYEGGLHERIGPRDIPGGAVF